ncbi:hypothetical protein L3Y34_000152 [Caenorhabditis briggsae]|uniref:Calpain catalytic domain-containing protein n=1 Tax=Caenorhabditis briggsae TaxID=6238 RepID=A0AAE9D8I3_CAEBR|nr:hypothetical protein L3Y34_000152 [Caenorhabditis briggsae]
MSSSRTVDYKKTISYSNNEVTVTETFVENRNFHRVVRTINGSPVVLEDSEKLESPKNDKVMVDEGSGDFELNYAEYLKDDEDEVAPDGKEIAVSKAPKTRANHGLGCRMKGLFDGFGGHDIKNIMRHMRRRHPRNGQALTNFMLSGKMEKVVDQHVRDFVHHFGRINPDNGRIMGAIRGNDFFNFGGLHNNLGNTGKVYLDKLISGKCGKRKVHKFKPIVPELDFGGKGAEPKAPGGTVAPPSKPVAPVPTPTPTSPISPIESVYPTPKASDFGLDFETEREKCLRNKTLFEDPEFPANNSSLYYRTPPRDRIIWKRPGEIIMNPQLITQGESRFDVKQGALGDCWLLAALANITLYDALFYRIVPPNQSFTENYAGIFHFQFWHYGKWVDVVVDDRLPTVNNKLYYLHSADNTEFWSALVEKAYAKLHGGYENLDGGTTAEALEDFTGGLTEYFDLRKSDKPTVLAALVKGMEMGSLFGCSIDADANIKEAQLRNGLVCGHAYSITAIHSIPYYGQDTTLMRLRNPWGNEKEWNGAWSDGSMEWSKIDEATKKQIDVQFARDGEFWMNFDDFFANFTQMELCNLTAEIFDEIAEMTGVDRAKETSQEEEHQWHEVMEDGEWSSKKGTAGGCNNNPSTYPKNPQFTASFTAPQSSIEEDGNVTVIVAVLQKYRRELKSKGKDLLPIGVSIYSVGASGGARIPLTSEFFSRNRAIAKTTIFVNTREVTVRFRVPPGEYVIVPCTFDAYDDAEFLLRCYANGQLRFFKS